MCLDGGQVILLYEGEQTLDGQRRHLEGGGGVHGWTLASCAPLEGGRRSRSALAEQLLYGSAMRTRCIFHDVTSAHFPFILRCVFVKMHSVVSLTSSLHTIKGEHLGHLFRLFQSVYSSERHGWNCSVQKGPGRTVNNARPTKVLWGGTIVLSFLSFKVMMLWDNWWTQPCALIISRLNLSHSLSHCFKL